MSGRNKGRRRPAPPPVAAPAPTPSPDWSALLTAVSNRPAPATLVSTTDPATGQRTDAWANTTTGFGTERDKAGQAVFRQGCGLSFQELTALQNEDDVGGTIVNLPVDEMFRRGFCVSVEDDKKGDQGKALEKLGKKVHFPQNYQKAKKWGRGYGGALLFVAWNDGQLPSMPLAVERINRETPVLYTKAFDRRYAQVLERDNEPNSPTFGDALVYSVGLGQQMLVHASRCIRFEGADVDDKTRFDLQGWTLSVLQRPYDAMQKFAQVYGSVANLVTDASQGVFSMKNLLALLSNPSKRGDVISRMKFLDSARSSMRAIVLDSDGEKFERVATPFAGLPETLEAFERRLSASCRIPVTLLMGDSPAGLGATGASDIRFFYDGIARDQPATGDHMLQFYGPLASSQGLDPEAVEITWPALWEMTDKEKADTDLANAQRDVAYVTAEIWRPEEVALSRAAGKTATSDTEIDEDSRTTTLAQNIEFDLSMTPEEKAALAAPPPPPPVDAAGAKAPKDAAAAEEGDKGNETEGT